MKDTRYQLEEAEATLQEWCASLAHTKNTRRTHEEHTKNTQRTHKEHTKNKQRTAHKAHPFSPPFFHFIVACRPLFFRSLHHHSSFTSLLPSTNSFFLAFSFHIYQSPPFPEPGTSFTSRNRTRAMLSGRPSTPITCNGHRRG